jgi:hypothetical protein
MKRLLFNPKICKAEALFMKRLMNRHPGTPYREIFGKINEAYSNVSGKTDELKVTEVMSKTG